MVLGALSGIFAYGLLKFVISKGVVALLMFIDACIYSVAAAAYSLFYKLAAVRLLKDNLYEILAGKIYMLIGVVAIFITTIALFKALVNPDDVGKVVTNSFKTLVISIGLLFLMPTIFKYAYSFQGAILQDKIIENFFNVDLTEKGNGSTDRYGQDVEKLCTFNTNDNGGEELIIYDTKNNEKKVGTYDVSKSECRANYMILSVLEGFFTPVKDATNNYGPEGQKTTYKDARRYMVATGDYSYILSFFDNVYNASPGNEAGYFPIFSGLAGIILVYVFLSFSIDVGVRCAKLAFFQIIAPIPIMMKLIPGREGQLNKWTTQTVSAFLGIVSRIAIISFIMFLARNLITIVDNLEVGGQSLGILGKSILIVGLFTFAKDAPKLFKEATGLEGDVTFGIGKKLTDSGVPAAAAAVGAGAGALIASRGNIFEAGKAFKSKDLKSIGQASTRYHDKQTALRLGATRGGMLLNSARGALGFGTTADAMDRQIELQDIENERTLQQQKIQETQRKNANDMQMQQYVTSNTNLNRHKSNNESVRSMATGLEDTIKSFLERSDSVYKTDFEYEFDDGGGHMKQKNKGSMSLAEIDATIDKYMHQDESKIDAKELAAMRAAREKVSKELMKRATSDLELRRSGRSGPTWGNIAEKNAKSVREYSDLMNEAQNGGITHADGSANNITTTGYQLIDDVKTQVDNLTNTEFVGAIQANNNAIRGYKEANSVIDTRLDDINTQLDSIKNAREQAKTTQAYYRADANRRGTNQTKK